LADGDAVSVQGAFKAELYTPDGGEPRISLPIIADQVVALRQPPRTKKAPAKAAEDARSRQDRCAGVWRDERDGPSDHIDDLEAL
jgi:hypothetical protein